MSSFCVRISDTNISQDLEAEFWKPSPNSRQFQEALERSKTSGLQSDRRFSSRLDEKEEQR